MTQICAEIASNHGGDWAWIARAVGDCEAAGVDIVKCQAYQTRYLRPGDPQTEWLRQAELSLDDLQRFHDLCRETGVDPLASVFDAERPAQLAAMGYTAVKIGSGECMRADVVQACLDHFGLIYVSNGLFQHGRLDDLVWGASKATIVPLMCVSQYPHSVKRVNFGTPAQWGLYDDPWGWSDHSVGLDACRLAVALGATVVEKHLRLDTGRQNVWDATVGEFAALCRWRDVVAVMTQDPDTLPSRHADPADLERFLGRWSVDHVR